MSLGDEETRIFPDFAFAAAVREVLGVAREALGLVSVRRCFAVFALFDLAFFSAGTIATRCVRFGDTFAVDARRRPDDGAVPVSDALLRRDCERSVRTLLVGCFLGIRSSIAC